MWSSLSVVLILAGGAGQVGASADQLQDKLSAAVSTYSVSADNLFQALHRLASDFAIPMGIEWIRGASTQRTLDRSWHDTTVFGIVKDIVGSYPGYYTEVGDGIVNVLPEGYKGDRRNVLNLSVSRFEARNEPLGVASWRLHVAVRAILRPAQVRSAGSGVAASIAYGAGGDRKVNVTSGPASLREILNRLVVSSSKVVWVVTYLEDKQATGPFHPTVVLTGDIVSEDQQPVWSFIPWGLDVFRNVAKSTSGASAVRASDRY